MARTLSIIHRQTGEVAEVVDVSGDSPHTVAMIRAAMWENLDREDWKISDSGED